MEVIRVSGRAPDVGDFLREAMLSQRFADVALCCPGGQKFLAHRLVLSAASPYLQEVLLAHSKTSSYCEPITVILAEVEGPELAALLGFVYTGSATVPRPRLDAFLRAAEALRIRLPPLPTAMRAYSHPEHERKLSPDDVKDVKLTAPYLHCEQYPSSWFWRNNDTGNNLDWRTSQSYAAYAERQLDPLELRMWSEAVAGGRPKAPLQVYHHEEPGTSRDIPEPTIPWVAATASTMDKTPDNISYGEDLTCRESCCKWRLPRRQVANQVTASPWRQIVRPHHSPKVQAPIVLQSHVEPTEQMQPTEAVPVPHVEMYRPATLSPCSGAGVVHCCLSPKPVITESQPPLPNKDAFYPVPTPSEQSGCYVCPTLAQRPPSVPLYPLNPTPLPARTFVNLEPSPRTKPELSLPVSRLCDSLTNDTVPTTLIAQLDDVAPRLIQQKPDDADAEIEVSEKNSTNAFPLLSDDNNNNEASIVGPEQQRTRSNSTPSIGQDDHKCEQCGKTFVTKASLKVHLRTHSGEKPFRCLDCGKQFSQLRNYKYHRSVHEGTREFAATCPECGKYFNDRGYLSSHMKIHRNRKEYACAECGKSFNQRVAYNMHVRIHTGLKPHQCEQCGKAFSRKMLLKQHLRTHSGERPYQCQVCHKAFADRSNMTLHTRLHSGLKPYQCTLCSKAFTKKHHLKTHLNYHTGTKPYSCPNCSLRFSQSSNMRTHYKKCALNNPNGLQLLAPSKQNTQTTTTQATTQPPALTPPNSDQESSILTPITRTSAVIVESAQIKV